MSRPDSTQLDTAARIIWASHRDDGEQPFTDVRESFDAVRSGIAFAVVDGVDWPSFTLESGKPLLVNPAWVECVILQPSDDGTW